MEVQLNVLDRLTLVSILPTTGRLQELVEVLDIVKLVKFNEEEKKSIGYKEVDGKVSWDPSKEVLKPYEFTFEHIKVIKDAINKLDEEGKITLNILDTCLKFSKL